MIHLEPANVSRFHQTNSICRHVNEILDAHSGDCICQDCGLVLGDSISGEELHSKYHNTFNNDNWEYGGRKFTSVEQMFVMDMSSKMMLPPGCVDLILQRYYSYLKIGTQRGKKFKLDHLSAYACYKVLKSMSIPRSLKQVQTSSGVDAKILWKIEKFFCEKTPPLKNSDSLASHYTKFGLTYYDLKEMMKMSDDLGKNLNFSPLTQSGFITYTYVKKVGKKFTMKEICSIFQISSMSLHRIKMYIRKHNSYFVMKYMLN